MLLGKGNGEFNIIGAAASGLNLSGNTKGLIKLSGNTESYIFGVRNNDKAFLYRIRKR